MEAQRAGFRADRLGPGGWLMGLASLALLVDLLAPPWYSLSSTFAATSAEFGAPTSVTGIQAHHLLGPAAVLCALVGLATWVSAATRRAPALPLAMTVIVLVLSAVLAVALLVRVVFDPPAVLLQGAPGVTTTRTDVAAVIGLFLTWGLALGAWISLRADGTAPADAPAQVETLRLARRPG